jgi:N-acetyl sugar amidotransferase
MNLKFCIKCLFPETKPDLFFNDEGVCSACIAAEEKNVGIDWEQKKKDFFEIIDFHKKPLGQPGWDCLIPCSGGKDSTYQAWFMKEKCGMNPLAVCFETTSETELGRHNLDNISKMGIDVIHFKKNHNAYKAMVIEGFKSVGDEMWPNHIGIFTVPILVAVKFNIPLVIYGENSQQEYGGPLHEVKNRFCDRKWLEEFGGLLGMRIEDMEEIEGVTKKELTPYFYPSDEDIKRVGVTSLFLGHYFFWDARKQLEIVKQSGFSVSDLPLEGSYLNYENLDEEIVSLHDYLKFVKYGFGRCTDHVGIDIRNGRMTREKGLELVNELDGKYPHHGVNEFMKYSGMTIEEIDYYIDKFTNPALFKSDEQDNFLRDKDKNLILNFNRV